MHATHQIDPLTRMTIARWHATDIFSLQELDIGCDRSGNADTFKEIGTQLGLNGLFACEFEELRSPMRDARSQGGGVHGNASEQAASS